MLLLLWPLQYWFLDNDVLSDKNTLKNITATISDWWNQQVYIISYY